MYVQAAMFAMQVLGGMGAAKRQKSLAKAQRTIDKANLEADRMNRESNNIVQNASASLRDYAKSINNQRASAATGAKLNALKTNALRTVDNLTSTGVMQSVQAAEQMGQVSALASAAGVGGGSIDMVKRAMNLRRDMQRQQLEKVKMQHGFDFKAQEGALISELAEGVDISSSLASLDYGIATAPIRGKGPGFVDSLLNVDWTLLRDAAHEFNTGSTATRYGTSAGSQQTGMLQKQDEGFF